MSTSSSMNLSDTVKLAERVQRTLYWRLLFAGALLCVIAGFALLTYTLERRKKLAETVVHMQAAQLIQTDQVLASAEEIVRRQADTGLSEQDLLALNRLLRVARNQTNSLGETIDVKPEVANAEAANAVVAPLAEGANPGKVSTTVWRDVPVAGPKIVRLYIQIASESQRPAAEAVAAAWSGRKVGSANVVVPGIELVPGADNSLRCTRTDTCKGIDPVFNWVNDSLVRPKLTKRDLTARYAGAAKILPGTYEVWFGPGPIELVPAARE